MNSDDFFAEVDTQLSKSAAAEAASKSTATENSEFLEQVITRLSPIVASYREQLNARNIRVDVQINASSISFTLRYNGGGYHGISIFGSHPGNRIEMNTNYTGDGGKRYTGTTGKTYDKSNWQDSLFEEALQQCIKDFLFYAGRYGGIASR